MVIVMTGAGGFIGRHVLKELLDARHKVVAIVHQNQISYGHPNLITVKLSLKELSHSSVAYDRLHGPDVLLDLGWQQLDDYQHVSHINMQVQEHLWFIRNLVKQGLKRVVGVGTCFEYGDVKGEISEQTSCNPLLNYPKGKLALLERLQKLQTEYAFELAWLRPFYVYGLNPARKTLFNAIQSAIENGNTCFELKSPCDCHDFLPVAELAQQIAGLATNLNAIGCINCCSGRLQTVRDIAMKYVAEQGAQLEFHGVSRGDEQMNRSFYGSTKKLDTLLTTSQHGNE